MWRLSELTLLPLPRPRLGEDAPKHLLGATELLGELGVDLALRRVDDATAASDAALAADGDRLGAVVVARALASQVRTTSDVVGVDVDHEPVAGERSAQRAADDLADELGLNGERRAENPFGDRDREFDRAQLERTRRARSWAA